MITLEGKSEAAMSPYLRSDRVISDMAMALSWISDLSDIRLVRRELCCAGFNEDDVDHYAECAVVYAMHRRALMGGPNQMTAPETHDEDK
jgi:hypothetical protein